MALWRCSALCAWPGQVVPVAHCVPAQAAPAGTGHEEAAQLTPALFCLGDTAVHTATIHHAAPGLCHHVKGHC